jgi:glutathione S-transferase
MKLYNANYSPNALRVRAVANELRIDLDFIEIDIMKGENKTEAYLALNPNGKVPVLVDGEFVLWESRAITGYLASLRPEHGLSPVDAKKRAVIDQWSYWQSIHLGPAMQKIAFERIIKAKFGFGEPDQKVIETQLEDVARLLPVLDANLADKNWVAGDLSVVDFAMASTFMYRDDTGISLAETPHVSTWIERLEARASWQSAVAPLLAMTAD